MISIGDGRSLPVQLVESYIARTFAIINSLHVDFGMAKETQQARNASMSRSPRGD